MAWWPRFIPQHGLDALKDYKYSAEDHSILTKLFLKRFWDWVVTLFPMWVAYVKKTVFRHSFNLLVSIFFVFSRHMHITRSLRLRALIKVDVLR